MYDELGEDGKRLYTVAQIAAEFGASPAPPSTATSATPGDLRPPPAATRFVCGW
jgi:hypothetical protein